MKKIVCISVWLVACSGSPPPAPPPPAEPSRPPSAPPAPPRATAPAAPALPAPAEPRLFELAKSSEPKHELRLLRLGDEVAVSVWSHIVPIRDDRVDVEHDFSEGLLAFGQVVAAGGRWPSDAWLTYITSNGRIGWGELYRWNKSAWIKQSTLQQGEVYLGMTTWTGGRLLTLSTDSLPIRHPPRHTFRAVGGGPVPKLARGKGRCTFATRPHGFTALESGHVFVVGERCRDDQTEETVIEWWAPNATRSTVTPIPGAKLGGAWYDETPVVAVELALDDVLVTGGKFVARFDGKGFSLLDTPSGKVSALARTEDGTVWGIFEGVAYRWESRKTWQPEPLAGDAKASSLVTRENSVYVGAGPSLYGSTRPKNGVQSFTLEHRSEARSFQVARPADRSCESVFVLLYAFTKVTPENYDFPLTRKALKGQTRFAKARFVITEEAEKKYLGAFMPTLGLGQELVLRIEREVKGSQPALLCAEPRVLREFPLDLATGELRQ